MRIKTFFIGICLLFVSLVVLGQEKAVIQILHSDEYRPNLKTNIHKIIGNVKLQHNQMLLYCDSLYQYADSNYIEAFGHVHAIQNDTLHLWGDFMTYDGNTEKAKVRDHVIMNDQPELI